MPEFTISRRTAVTPVELIAAFMDTVEHPDSASKRIGSIEGTVEDGVMRWRERSFESESGAAHLGPQHDARAESSGGVLTIRVTMATSAYHRIGALFGAIAFLALFAVAMFVSPDEWHGSRWTLWLLPVCAALLGAMPFWNARSSERRARAFLDELIDVAEDS